MARIIVGGGNVNTNNTTPGPQSPNQNPDEDNAAGKKLGKFASKYYRIPVTMGIAAVSYLAARYVLPSEQIAWWAIEIFSFLLSMLVLWGISELSPVPKVATSVFLFTLALFIFFIVRGYNKNHVEDTSQLQKTQPTLVNEISVPVLDIGTHTFLLEKVGDDTGFFQYPDGDNYSGRISSQDYGYDIQYSDGSLYHGGPKVIIPPKPHGILKVIATQPNQYVRVVVHTY